MQGRMWDSSHISIRVTRVSIGTGSTFVEKGLDFSTDVENAPRHSSSNFMAKPEIELTESEWAIIKAVWESEPCAAPAIQEKLFKQTGWTYSTVRTLMDRMVAKGLLAAEKVRNLTMFRSAVTREQAQKGELLYALKNAFNGALTPMVECLLDTSDLTAEELSRLRQLIDSYEPDKPGAGKVQARPGRKGK
jgi:BlaI family penicillinase repressor